ncbi:uncharacterized protein DAT39_003226, partial [Clarias magur]
HVVHICLGMVEDFPSPPGAGPCGLSGDGAALSSGNITSVKPDKHLLGVGLAVCDQEPWLFTKHYHFE